MQSSKKKTQEDIHIGKEEVKLSFTDDMIFSVGNSNKYLNILPELINKSVKVAGYKNTIVYLYTSNRQSKNQV